MSSISAELLWSSLYAVVLSHQRLGGSRVRWNSVHQAWVGSYDFARGMTFPWKPQPGSTMSFEDRPSDDDISAAIHALQVWQENVERWGTCEKCGTADLKMHFITPDVFGDPKIYCVQRPDYSVVDSSGGSGQLKHWGSHFGCQSVEQQISFNTKGTPRMWQGAAYLYGEPLTAEQVINRDWCSRCTRVAYNLRSMSPELQKSRADYYLQEGEIDIKFLARQIREYIGDS